MRYFKTVDENNIIDFGYCGKYIPVGSIEITEEEYESMLEEANQYSAAVESYIKMVQDGEITLDEVPEEYRADVEAQVNQTEPDPEQAVVDSIMQEVSSYGY